MSIANEPAFPLYGFSTWNGQGIEQVFNGGMTLRQYYAGLALQGILASGDAPCGQRDIEGDTWQAATARSAISCADALIAELEKQK